MTDDPPSDLPGDDAAEPDRQGKARSPRNVALDILSRREHSVAELRQKLRAREFDPAVIEATLAALEREGLLSEARFLETFVGSYSRRGQGPVWIRAELERRGIGGEAIAAALADHAAEWPALARGVREKRFGSEVPADFKERARQSRFLQYRGFTAEQVRQAFRDEPGAGADDDLTD